MTKEMKIKITKELIEELRKCIRNIEVDSDRLIIGIDNELWVQQSHLIFEGYALDYEEEDFNICTCIAFERIQYEVSVLLGGI